KKLSRRSSLKLFGGMGLDPPPDLQNFHSPYRISNSNVTKAPSNLEPNSMNLSSRVPPVALDGQSQSKYGRNPKLAMSFDAIRQGESSYTKIPF
ncbi:hypothetical protein HAX54_023694, partial [Datura stramonium]|nr:hypothetical protein [Datura stramonium]